MHSRCQPRLGCLCSFYSEYVKMTIPWGVVQWQHTRLWICGSWFESRRPSLKVVNQKCAALT